MAYSNPPEQRHDEFIKFVQRELQPGVDGDNNEVEFISPSKTSAWWKKRSENRLGDAINPQINARAATIEKGYLNIFSILAYISKTYLINHFTSNGFQDQQLPLLDTRRFGTDVALVRDMEDFVEHQWTFCPVVFFSHMPMDRRVLPCRQILPIKDEKRTTAKPNHAKSVIRIVTLHPECFDPTWSQSGTVVFKEYHTRERDTLRNAWINEYNAFVKIDCCDHIVQYLGSFEQDDRCFMVLEYASHGSLLDLFREGEPPSAPEERRYFLYGMMGLIKAIDKIQNLGSGTQRTGFAHRDIKPANILVFPGRNGLYSAGFKMKLADFDTATPELPIDEAEFSVQDNNGNRTYCKYNPPVVHCFANHLAGAPEASRIYTYQDKTIRKVPLSSDIWSLGCVFSEALIWVGGGRGALEQAARDRRNEIQTYYQIMVGGSYGECFHNAQIALNCVVQSQIAAVEALEGPTNLSGSVCTLVRVGMLVPHEQRYSPSSLWHDFKSKYDYLFPSPGRAYSAPTHSRPQHLSPGVSSPVSTRRSLRRDEPKFGQEFHQRTASNPGTERLTIGDSDRYQSNSDPTDTIQSPYYGATFNNGASIHRGSPVILNPGESPDSPRLDSCVDNALKLWTNDLETSQTIASNSPRIGTPLQDDRRQSSYKSPINNLWDTTRLHPHRDQYSQYGATTVKDAVTHRKIKAKKQKLDGYDSFCRRMGRRHFIFVIDDSDSMRGVKSEVVEVVEILVWLVKDIDISCPEIRFTSKPDKRHPSAFAGRFIPYTMDMLTSPLRHWLSGDEAEKECNMRYALNQIFSDSCLIDPKKPTSVLVFTNGIWEGGATDERGVEDCITNVLRKMREKGVSDTGFTFQFVSFGDDQDGLERMIYLDDAALFGGTRDNRVDIVDHKRHTDNVWSILTGAVSKKNDDSSHGTSTGRHTPC
ncbi:uncharacterized protein FIESC28_04100 [Fusarium coffeatum]|uniref:Protein kinase domain-containing protein n=1 Tax=Fusarium coffeatum TaxID=231269 RepID=A0A366S399_9HYPO|nr:uncharacterized protein FIESC28_04100 [Fusarium coffeatum]RBR23105.1 hypothetical protein FIESC28_04100 [Fusarium coffeatum]